MERVHHSEPGPERRNAQRGSSQQARESFRGKNQTMTSLLPVRTSTAVLRGSGAQNSHRKVLQRMERGALLPWGERAPGDKGHPKLHFAALGNLASSLPSQYRCSCKLVGLSLAQECSRLWSVDTQLTGR